MAKSASPTPTAVQTILDCRTITLGLVRRPESMSSRDDAGVRLLRGPCHMTSPLAGGTLGRATFAISELARSNFGALRGAVLGAGALGATEPIAEGVAARGASEAGFSPSR